MRNHVRESFANVQADYYPELKASDLYIKLEILLKMEGAKRADINWTVS
ncbi:hypothetical protein [Paenibacillus pseudetheri]|nr:hypothetical protein [Paenibacillus pseudetheri]